MNTRRILVIIGTRPEAIKLAPVIRELDDQAVVVSTGQHREMLAPLLARLGIRVETDLKAMTPGATPTQLAATLLQQLPDVLDRHQPRAVVVQGDTTTALAAALSAFLAKIPVAHVEAGLRSGRLDDPFPEEGNRRLVGQLATWHYAPTPRAAANLRSSGVAGDILTTGNTVVDNLLWAIASVQGAPQWRTQQHRILVTLHRRENQGHTMSALAEALARIAARGDVEILLPLHKSPAVRASLNSLADTPGVRLTEPLDYFDFVATLASSKLILTDSGGVQEEAPTFSKPVLVLRRTTERPEAIESGSARLVGTNPAAVVDATHRLLDDPLDYAAMTINASPFGDGRAAERICTHLLQVTR